MQISNQITTGTEGESPAELGLEQTRSSSEIGSTSRYAHGGVWQGKDLRWLSFNLKGVSGPADASSGCWDILKWSSYNTYLQIHPSLLVVRCRIMGRINMACSVGKLPTGTSNSSLASTPYCFCSPFNPIQFDCKRLQTPNHLLKHTYLCFTTLSGVDRNQQQLL